MTDKELIKLCVQELRRKLGYDDSAPVRQRDIEHLSSDIEEKTGILISISTIKRLLSGQFAQLPQSATLNAITAYVGYKGWQDFRAKKIERALAPIAESHPDDVPKKPTTERSYLKATALLIVGFFVAAAAFSFLSRKKTINPDDVSFSVRKITANDIPNTVVFNYDISKVDGDSFFIQQSWDTDRRVKISKYDTTLTDIYFEPGYHNAKLIVDDQVVKTIDVSIPTNGWFFHMKPGLFKGQPTYIRPEAPIANGVLSLKEQDIIGSKIDPDKENYYTYCLFPDQYDVNSDNFTFKTRVRLKELKNVNCPTIFYEVCGQSNAFYFFTTLPGCTGNISANVGEYFMNGKTTDLSGFGCDVNNWHDIEVTVKENDAYFFIDGKQVFEKAFSKSPGLLTGLMLSSNGIVEIDEISLKSLDGKVVYENTFDQ